MTEVNRIMEMVAVPGMPAAGVVPMREFAVLYEQGEHNWGAIVHDLRGV